LDFKHLISLHLPWWSIKS